MAGAAGLAFGAAGAFFFGPVGFMVGSFVGNLLFPAKGQDGPRLQDLRLQGSSYGKMIPIVMGSMRVAGVVVWQTDLQEHSHRSGGKGGPSASTYTYSASLAIKVCKGPLAGVHRIWADGKLIYSTLSGITVGGHLPVTVYLGVENALPDPTMEAVEGVGNVPAFRDDAALVFSDWDLTDYGNRIPNLEFDVFTDAGTRPWRVSTYNRLSGHTRRSGIVLNEDGTTTNSFLDWQAGGTHTSTSRVVEVRDIDGTLVSTATTAISTYNGFGIFSASQCDNNSSISEITASSNTNDFGAWYYDESLVGNPIEIGTNALVVFDRIIFYNNNVYAIGQGGTPFIARYPSLNGVTGTTANASYALSSTSSSINWAACISDDGFIYVSDLEGHGRLQKLDVDLNLIHDWGTSGPAIISYNFVIYRGEICWLYTDPGGATFARLQSIGAGSSFTDIGMCAIGIGDLISLQNGLVSVQDGLISLNPRVAPITYATAVTKITELCGASAATIDVSQLMQSLDGYIIDSQKAGKDALTPLQSADYFDGIESSTVRKFVRRSEAPVITIDDNDLGTRALGTAQPALLLATRGQEEDVPSYGDVSYVDSAADYQVGNQVAQRQVTRSQQKVSIQLQIAMTPAKGKEIIEKLIFNAAMERDRYEVTLPRKYAYVEPTDLIIAQDVLVRINEKGERTDRVVKFDGVGTMPAIWLGAPVAGSRLGFSSVIPPSASRVTPTLLLLDIPMITDDDYQSGFYAVSTRDASLYKSTDGGTTYALIGSVAAGTMGTTSTELGNFLGGNMFDEGNSVTVVVVSGELASITELATLNSGNECVIGNEVLQFKDAVLGAPDTYTLTGLLRGRRGTEFAMHGHAAGERFAMLPATNFATALAEINQSRQYKAVAAGQSLGNVTAQAFTNTGASLRTYSPVLVGGGPDLSNGIVCNWTRRTRTGGAWMDYVDAALGEATEAYVLQVWNAARTICARVVTGITSPIYTYSAADQVIDFGSIQRTAFITVGQIGAVGLGIQTSADIPGAGATNDTPLNSAVPFGSVPPPVSVGCTLPMTSTIAPWDSTRVFYPGFAPGNEWVVSFTTGAAVSGNGKVVLAEYGGPPVQRDGTLALSPCGPALIPACHVTGLTLTIFYWMLDNPYPAYYPTLMPFTTYCFSVTTAEVSSAFCAVYPPNGL